MDPFSYISNPTIKCIQYDSILDMSSKNNIRGDTLIHLNIRSLRKNWNALLININIIVQKVNLIGIMLTEVNICKEEINNYKIEGFNVIHNLRQGRKGGGIIYYAKCDMLMIVQDVNMLSCESIVAKISSKGTTLRVIGIYRPPDFNKNHFIEELEQVLDGDKSISTIVIGDMNINIKDGKDVTSIRYLNMFSSCGFASVINRYTREEIRNGILSQTCIDHVFYRGDTDYIEGVLIKAKIADHHLVGCTMNILDEVSLEKVEKVSVEYRLDNKRVKREILHHNWNSLLKESCTMKLYEKICWEFSQIYRNSTGAVKKINNLGRKPENKWISKKILQQMQERDKAYKKWKSNKTNKTYHLRYKILRNKCIKEINDAKRSYYHNILGKINDGRELWNVINIIRGKDSKKDNDDMAIKHLCKHMDSSTICNEFANNFTDGVMKLKLRCSKKLGPSSSKSVLNSLFIPEPSISEIENIVKQLKNKASGVDGIRMKDIKNNPQLIPIITTLIKNSVSQGIVPQGMKVAHVRPIHKNGSYVELDNYRPISLLPSLSKILEKYVASYLIKFLSKFNIINNDQYGFQKNKGTRDALEKFSDIVNSSLNKNNYVIVTFIDYKKAFDTVNHEIMLDDLMSIGIRGKVWDWFRSYLSNRQMAVKFNNSLSNIKNVNYGVPQGSILGPILFTIYVNEIFKVVRHSNILMYADDVVLITNHKNLSNAEKLMQEDLNRIAIWSHDNDLVINTKKSKVMEIFSRSIEHTPIKLYLHDHNCLHRNFDKTTCSCMPLEQVAEYKYLGLHIDQYFKFDKHIIKVNSKLRKVVYQLYQINALVPADIKLTIYHALVESILRYGITVWGGTSTCYKEALQATQNKIIKMIYKGYDIMHLEKDSNTLAKGIKYCNDNVNSMYEKLGILNLNNLYRYVLIINNYFSGKHNIHKNYAHRMDKRYVTNYHVPNYYNNYGKNVMSVKIPMTLNGLPHSLKKIESIRELKINTKNYLLNRGTFH